MVGQSVRPYRTALTVLDGYAEAGLVNGAGVAPANIIYAGGAVGVVRQSLGLYDRQLLLEHQCVRKHECSRVCLFSFPNATRNRSPWA